MFGGSATPTARNTGPIWPLTGVRMAMLRPVFLDFAALQAVEITQERTPLGFDPGLSTAVEQLLVQHQGEEGAEDMAANGGIG